MLYIKSDYYDDFQCTAGQCEDTCCAGWQIVIDKDSLKRYQEETTSYKRKLKKSINWKKGVFRQDKTKRCAFLRDDNKCDLYLNLGQHSLCRTCSMYPRHVEEFEGVREMTISISCPEAAKYLTGRTSPVRFRVTETDEEETCPDYADMDFDLLLYDFLAEVRTGLISILQNRAEPIGKRLETALYLGAEAQAAVDNGSIFACQDLVDSYVKGRKAYQKHKLKNPMEYARRVFKGLFAMELLSEDWDYFLNETAASLFLDGPEAYQAKCLKFHQWIQDQGADLDILYEQLAVYFISTYFCGAVYSGDILAKVQFSVLSVYIIHQLFTGQVSKQPDSWSKDRLYEIVYRFSRELEHSDHNLSLLEKLAAAALPLKGRGQSTETVASQIT